MRKFSWMLLVLFVFWAGCQGQPKVHEPSLQSEVVVESAEELKGLRPRRSFGRKMGLRWFGFRLRIPLNLFGWTQPKLLWGSLRSSWIRQATQAKILSRLVLLNYP